MPLLLTNLQKFFRHLRNTTQNRQSNEAGHQLGWSVSLYICKERAHKDGLHCACVAHIYSPDLYLYPATLRCRVFLFYCLPLQGDAQYPVSTRFVKMTKRGVSARLCLSGVESEFSKMTKKELQKGVRLVCEFENDKTDAEDTYVPCR